MSRIATLALLGLALSPAAPAAAQQLQTGGKLVLTNGISSAEGASGGGLTPWATIAGNETRDGIGAQGGVTFAELRDYDLLVIGGAVGFYDRFEISYARQEFDLNAIGGALGLGNDFSLDQDVYGAKLKLLGDAVYGPEMLPAVALGVQYKRNLDGDVARAVGARDDEGIDYYLSATKLLLRHSLLVNVTARLTEANQLGLLGFGGDRHDGHDLRFEGSAAYQLARPLVVGAEFRSKPDNLSFAAEEDALDVFAAYAVGRHATATLAYSDLGAIGTREGQRGVLVQLQAAF